MVALFSVVLVATTWFPATYVARTLLEAVR